MRMPSSRLRWRLKMSHESLMYASRRDITGRICVMRSWMCLLARELWSLLLVFVKMVMSWVLCMLSRVVEGVGWTDLT